MCRVGMQCPIYFAKDAGAQTLHDMVEPHRTNNYLIIKI